MSFEARRGRLRTRSGSLDDVSVHSANIRNIMLTFVFDCPHEVKHLVVIVIFILSKPVHSHRQRTSRSRSTTDEQNVVKVCGRWHVTIGSFYRRPPHSFGVLKSQSVQLFREAILSCDDELCRVVRDQRERMCLEVSDTWDPQESVRAWLCFDRAVQRYSCCSFWQGREFAVVAVAVEEPSAES